MPGTGVVSGGIVAGWPGVAFGVAVSLVVPGAVVELGDAFVPGAIVPFWSEVLLPGTVEPPGVAGALAPGDALVEPLEPAEPAPPVT